MMTEKRIREYREELIAEIKKLAEAKRVSSWELACERLWTLDFILGESGKPKYMHPEDRFAFAKTQEAAR